MRTFLKILSSAGSSKPVQDKGNDSVHVAVMPVVCPEARDEGIPHVAPTASLEGLPTELRSAILLRIRDIASLKSLIHASPTYHSAYLGQRLAVLEQVLSNSIPTNALYDAFSAITSLKTLTSDAEDRLARVEAFLSEYKDNRGTWKSPEDLDLETASRLAQLQNHVQHVTEDFCQVALSSNPFTGNHADFWEQLSSNESRRFYRAFYRFEIFCNLFRNRKDSPDDESLSDTSYEDGDSTSELDSFQKESRFLSLFKPWEVEELACVRDYFCNYYRRMLHKFEPDLRERNPNLDLSDDGSWLEENIEYLMALSLCFYRRMQTSSPDRQMRFLDYGLQIGPSFLSDALKKPPQAAVYQVFTMDDPVEIHFEGDNVRGGPNAMWLWATGNKMDFNYFLWQNEPLREWGYVFWDKKRLGKWGVPNEEYRTWVERRRAGLRKMLAERSC